MKKFLCILAALCVILSLGACKTKDDVPSQSSSAGTENTVPSTTDPQETVIQVVDPDETQAAEDTWLHVYEGAVRDYLTPVEEFSWVREHKPEFVMIHFSSAVVNHRSDPFNMKYIRQIFVDYDISVHYVIERDGTIHCYIPEDRVAWHAGVGTFNNDPKYTNKMNLYSIGIELTAIGSESDMAAYLTPEEYRNLDNSLKGFTAEQYASLKVLVADICERYDIPMDRQHVIGHEEYSTNLTDPGELFNWSQIIP